MNFKPLFDRVVLKNIEKNKQTKSGLFIPTTAGDEPVYGKVVAVGDGESLDNNQSEMRVKIGDKVLYNKYGATYFKDDETEYVILRQSDILGVFIDEK